MRDLKLETLFRSRLRRLVEIRRVRSEELDETALRLVDRCIYSSILDLRELGVDLREAAAVGRRDG